MPGRLAPFLVAGVALTSLGAPQKASTPLAPPVPLGRLVGQRLMVGFPGTKAPARLLTRIKRGQVGGVILMGANIGSRGQVRALTRRLQRAAAAGGNAPLLIGVDQE